MAEPVNPLAENLIFLLQEKVGFVELLLLSPQPPEVKQPSLAQSGEERQGNEKSANDIYHPAL